MDVVERLDEHCRDAQIGLEHLSTLACLQAAKSEILRLRSERDSAFERAAKVIDDNMLCSDDDGNEVLMPRTNPGNKVGFAYASSIRSLKGT